MFESFQTDVVEASEIRPIVVDFWAEWCGPCRALGPVLEKVAAEAGDAWHLVKVNVDEHQEAARTYRVQGIPAVKMFHHGDVVAEFTGALPEPQVRSWLAENLPSDVKDALAEADRLVAGGKGERAAVLLEDILAREPGNPEAHARLAGLILTADPRRALDLVTGIGPGDAGAERAEAVATLARLLTRDAGADGPGWATYRAGIEAFRRGDHDTALQQWIETIGSGHRDVDDDGPRRACIALFQLLGEQSEVTRRHRRAFSSALF